MISASLPGDLGQLGHAYPGVLPPTVGMTNEFLAPRPYSRYPPRPVRPRDPPAPFPSYRFMQHPASYQQYVYRTPTLPIRPRPTSGFVPPAPRSPPEPIASTERGYFCRGALIRLEDGTLRRVEDMRTEDFVASADRRADLALTNCTLLAVDERGDHLSLTLAYDRNRSQVELESTIEHPFFVCGRGWASWCPERTLQRYGLRVRRLVIGDVCVSMMERRPALPSLPTAMPPVMPPVTNVYQPPPQVTLPPPPAPPQTYPENLSVKEDARSKRRWSASDVCEDERPPAKKR